MRIKIFLLFLLTMSMGVHAQEMKSKADKYFYSYNYKEAIAEYKKDMAAGVLVDNYQLLNLADAYFSVRDYKNAAKVYLDINSKDTIMSNHRFNKMLQSLSQTSGKDRVKAFLKTKKASLSKELYENAEFNFELLQADSSLSQQYDIFNVSANSAHSDISPTYYKDDRLLFSSSRPFKSKKVSSVSGEAYLDIYIARIDGDGNVLNPNVFRNIPDSKYHKATPFYTEKSNKLFYILSNAENGQLSFDDKGKNALALAMVDSRGEFSYLLRDLSTSFYYPFYDEASERLYFAANFEDGYGGTDIYYVVTSNGQIMSRPINLGPQINSPGNEISPYIFNGSLYFSSDAFYGLGGMDIYKVSMLEDGNFSIPINLGAGINTEADEFGFILKEGKNEGFTGYFVSNRKGGKGNDDIYGFKTQGVIGSQTIAIQGTVVEPKYQHGIEKAKVQLIDANGKVIKEVWTDDSGTYRIEIPAREKIVLLITKEEHSSFYESYSGEALQQLQRAKLKTALVAIDDWIRDREGKKVLDIDNFYFETAKSEITPEIALELNQVVDVVAKFPQIQFNIETHTDSRGNRKSNKIISQKRADAIKAYLLKKGVPASAIKSATGYGEERIMNNCTNGVYCLDFLHKQNLRTLFVVLNYEELKK